MHNSLNILKALLIILFLNGGSIYNSLFKNYYASLKFPVMGKINYKEKKKKKLYFNYGDKFNISYILSFEINPKYVNFGQLIFINFRNWDFSFSIKFRQNFNVWKTYD